MTRHTLVALLWAATLRLAAAQLQMPLVPGGETAQREHGGQIAAPESARTLKGRFLHITDIHIDPHYRPGTKASKSCHRKEGAGGILGYPGTRCDSPLPLLDATFDWIKENLIDDIDFIVWTGDAARHDNDKRIPRSVDEVLNQNQLVVDHVLDFFTDPKARALSQPTNDARHPPQRPLKIPFIPNIGNNDFMPHNVFAPGPNCWTKSFARLWHRFIPPAQRAAFLDGGWFAVEAIPDRLAVVSLNTMYFFDRNGATHGCGDPAEPGHRQFEWLRGEFERMRERGMKVILLGHVPPALAGKKMNWVEGCWHKYVLWMRQYRDIIVGSMYGHMNLDHFILQDFDNVTIGDSEARIDDYGVEDEDVASAPVKAAVAGQGYTDPDELILNSKGRAKYLDKLRKQWYRLPEVPVTESSAISLFNGLKRGKKRRRKEERYEKIGGEYTQRYSVSLVSPSVIPNYYPTIRVIEYNISGLENARVWRDSIPSRNDIVDDSECDLRRSPSESGSQDRGKGKKKGRVEVVIPASDVPKGPSKSDLPGPAYSNQALTWLSYTQYYSNITKIEEEMDDLTTPDASKDKKKHGGGSGKHKTYPANFKYEVLYDTRTDDVYRMKDLTVRSYLELAKKIGKGYKRDRRARKRNAGRNESEAEVMVKRNEVWRTFISRAFVGMYEVDDLEEMI